MFKVNLVALLLPLNIFHIFVPVCLLLTAHFNVSMFSVKPEATRSLRKHLQWSSNFGKIQNVADIEVSEEKFKCFIWERFHFQVQIPTSIYIYLSIYLYYIFCKNWGDYSFPETSWKSMNERFVVNKVNLIKLSSMVLMRNVHLHISLIV